MKPKTIIQKKVTALSALLPQITKRQELLFHQQTKKYAVRSARTIYCLECGHQWINPGCLETALLGCTCPKCNAVLEMHHSYEPRKKELYYFAILTTKENMQVVRMYFITKQFLKRNPARYHTLEVMQHWIEPNGKMTTMATKTNSMSVFFDQWLSDSTLEVRTNTENFRSRVAIVPGFIHPHSQVLPVISRNGFRGSFHRMSPHRLFSLILCNNYAETLLKTKQIPLLKSMIHDESRVEKYWYSIRICIKHKYLVKDATLWFDHLKLLAIFEKDLYNPKYICPENLHHEHQLLIDKKARLDAKTERAKLLEQFENQQKLYHLQKHKFFGLSFSRDNLIIRPLINVSEFYDEGKLFNHCIYSNNYFMKKDSLILSARINNIPVETVEISLKEMAVIQARGRFNKPTKHHDFIVSLVNENLSLISKCNYKS